MENKQGLKNKLLSTEVFIDNEYLDQYCDLMFQNYSIDVKFQQHHVIPRAYFKFIGIECDDSESNLKALPGNIHILAHYYLYKCSKEESILRANYIAFNNMMHNSRFCTELTSDQINYIKNNIPKENIFKHSENTKIIMSQRALERQSVGGQSHFWDYGHKANLGKKRTPEQILNMSKAHIGKSNMSEDGKKAISKANSHPQSEEHKLKRSLARKEYYKNMTKEEKEKYYKNVSKCKGTPVYCIELNEYFPNAMAAQRKYGVQSQSISNIFKGIQHVAGGYHWKKLTREEYNSIMEENTKMILSNIYPIPNQEFYKNEKVVMLLAHIFDKYDPQYFNKDQLIMLDNGIYEGCQVSTNLEDIIMMAENSPIPVKEFIVPDKFYDYEGNIKMFEENLPIIRKWNHKYRFMVSLHHSNFEEFCKAMEYMKQYKDEGLNLVMGIPKKALFDRQSTEAIEQYKNCPYPIHFLGLTDTDPLNKLNKVKDLIRSCDTSQLVTLLINNGDKDNIMGWTRDKEDKVIDLVNDNLNSNDIEYCLNKIKF